MLIESLIIFFHLHKFSQSMNPTRNYAPHHSVYHDSFNSMIESEHLSTSFTNRPGAPRRIVGGHQCSVEKYPFIISLRRSSSLIHFCAGTLITPDWVLTAGHCVAPHVTEPELFTAIAGISQSYHLGVQKIRVNHIFVHPEYDENNYENDISLISLEHGFVITEVVRPISIPNQVIHGDLYSICPGAIAIGWGWHNDAEIKHNENGSIPHVPVMQCVINLPVLSEQMCQQARAGMHLHPNTFCTMAQTWKNICQGDSGGPLICNDVQLGIVSSGYGCSSPEHTPGYYTRIDNVLNFVKECISGRVSYYRRMNKGVEDKSSEIRQNTVSYLLSILLLHFLNTILLL